jgi:hypothetical protein
MLYSSVHSTSSGPTIREMIHQLQYGEGGSELAVNRLEAEYGVSRSSEDDILDIRDGVLGEAIGRCLENAEGERRRVLLKCIEVRWAFSVYLAYRIHRTNRNFGLYLAQIGYVRRRHC